MCVMIYFNTKRNNIALMLKTQMQKTTEEEIRLLAQKKESKGTDRAWLNYIKAAFLLILGTAITVLLAQPLMQTLQEFSTAVNIPSFLVSYVVIPLALNYRQTLRAITSSRQKTENAISLTFSEVYFSPKLIFSFDHEIKIPSFISSTMVLLTSYILIRKFKLFLISQSESSIFMI